MDTAEQAWIPLNKLVAWDGNVRKTAGADTALHELASSIAAHGLINNLVVKTPGMVPIPVAMADRNEDELNALSRKGLPDLLAAAHRSKRGDARGELVAIDRRRSRCVQKPELGEARQQLAHCWMHVHAAGLEA